MDKGIYILMVDTKRNSVYTIGAKSYSECLKNMLDAITENDLERYNIEDINKLSIEVAVPAKELLKNWKTNH